MRKSPSEKRQQSWRTFLTNHRAELWAMDLFTVPTLLFQVLYVLVVVRHDRRRIQHIAVTLHPTAEWIVQQLREATPFGEQPTYLLHDNGAVFVSAEVRQFLRNAGMKSARIAYRSPWQNGIVERTIGILRREICDHLIPINAGHLQRLLNEYVHDYYNPVRTHQGIDRQTPLISTNSLPPGPLPDDLVAKPVLGGLYHTYRRAA